MIPAAAQGDDGAANGGTGANGSSTPARDVVAESSVGGQILNPYPGEQIVDRQPMIGVKLPQTDPPVDPASITIFMDGSDVTSETQISSEYIFYVPQIPLKLGTHNVRISMKDIDGTVLPAVVWDFNVVERISERVVQPVAEQKPSTTGRLYLLYEDINLNRSVRPEGTDTSDIRYRETLATSANFTFTHKFFGTLRKY